MPSQTWRANALTDLVALTMWLGILHALSSEALLHALPARALAVMVLLADVGRPTKPSPTGRRTPCNPSPYSIPTNILELVLVKSCLSFHVGLLLYR